MLQNFLTKMYDYDLDSNKATPQPQGFTLQQVSDAWDASANYLTHRYSVSHPSKEQYLATLTPAPDVKEVAVAFSKYCYSQDTNIDKLTFDYWYENIYPGVIEQTKK